MSKILSLLLIVLIINCLNQKDAFAESWWETLKQYDDKFNKAAEEIDKQLKQALYIKQKKEEQQKKEKKLSKESQDRAIEEIVKFLRDKMDNPEGAAFIKNRYDAGNLIFGDEDSQILWTITIDKDHLLTLFRDDGTVNFRKLVNLTTVIIHEGIHSRQWGAFLGMTSNSAENDAYLGALTALSNWMNKVNCSIEDNLSIDPCSQIKHAQELEDITNEIKYYDSIIYEKSTERRQAISESLKKAQIELNDAYKKQEKFNSYIAQIELYHYIVQEGLKKQSLTNAEKQKLFKKITKSISVKKNTEELLKDINKAINAKAEEIKTYESQLQEPALDVSKFRWTDDKGNSYDRKGLLALAEEKNKVILEVKQKCEESKKKRLTEDDKKKILADLCWCACNPTVGGGAKYDVTRGCVCVGVLGGESIAPIPMSGPCIDYMSKSSKIDPKLLSEEARKNNIRIYQQLINNAQDIMQEYNQLIFGRKSQSYFYQYAYNLDSDIVITVSSSQQDLILGSNSIPLVEKIKEKNRRGDIDRVINLIRQAEMMLPEKKASGETTNILAEFAIILAKSSISLLPYLEFDEGLFMLNKAREFYNVDNTTGKDIASLVQLFTQWKQAWISIQSDVSRCIEFLNQRQVCKCERIYNDNILRFISILNIYHYPSSEKWEIFTGIGAPLVIPEKDKLISKIKGDLSSAKADCDAHPILKTPEMNALIKYETRKVLEKSPNIDQNQLKKQSAPVICGVNAVRYAEKMLSIPELCDCHQDRLRAIIDIAKKDGEPMTMDFTVSSQEVFLGDRVILRLSIKGGRPPFDAELTGSDNFKKTVMNQGVFI